jgi:alkylhydroperoxidase family enzyme
MAWIRETRPEDAEGELRALYDRVAEPDGSVDHILRIHGIHPRSLRSHFDLYVTAMRGRSPLSRARREMIAVVVSSLNGCEY